jgi:hypothetical protein
MIISLIRRKEIVALPNALTDRRSLVADAFAVAAAQLRRCNQ